MRTLTEADVEDNTGGRCGAVNFWEFVQIFIDARGLSRYQLDYAKVLTFKSGYRAPAWIKRDQCLGAMGSGEVNNEE